MKYEGKIEAQPTTDRKWLWVCLISVAFLLLIFLGASLGWQDTNVCSTFQAYDKKACVEPPTTIYQSSKTTTTNTTATTSTKPKVTVTHKFRSDAGVGVPIVVTVQK